MVTFDDLLKKTVLQGSAFVIGNTCAAALCYTNVELRPRRGSPYAVVIGTATANLFALNSTTWAGHDAHLYYLGMATSISMSSAVYGLLATRAATTAGTSLAGACAFVCGGVALPLWHSVYRTAD